MKFLDDFNDVELIQLIIELRKYPEDEEYLNKALIELGKRQKEKDKTREEP